MNTTRFTRLITFTAVFLTFLTTLPVSHPLVEKLDPTVVVSAMDEYIGVISAIVFENGGTVDTVVGDAVHAIFGAPLEQPDHAARGVACALAIDAFSRAFAEEKAGENIPVGITRIGVHTGPAIVGDFGGENYFHYTAHGDAVNTLRDWKPQTRHPEANDSDTSTTKSRGLAPMNFACSTTGMPNTGHAVCAPQKRGISSRPTCAWSSSSPVG